LALARVRDLCRGVEKLFHRLVPHALPIIGDEPASPVLTDQERRSIVDELMARIAPWEEWSPLVQALPEHSDKLRLLARALDELKQRFETEDYQWEDENAVLATHPPDAASGLEFQGGRVLHGDPTRRYPAIERIRHERRSFLLDGKTGRFRRDLLSGAGNWLVGRVAGTDRVWDLATTDRCSRWDGTLDL
jgi:hypothetical protein